ncbi:MULTISPECIES: ABC transporter substrate-binding protein [unclassified Fibrobacter]|uniref:ABC transporter substrate-binding protein n=1 Tax=unclassified Fibrobacter TaxID=2634177 RepID=UPI00091759F8|nr:MULTISPECIES: ABC transporter substrate-binding protein [unclassified Fibrobacter]SHK21855.1 peptide/nickel transport system substrate-binding protein [Fibrobacter sp. UWB12]SIO15104.1 peptide/nickel transport system substrate-binding protein [Fibrobacter sp. UWB11]
MSVHFKKIAPFCYLSIAVAFMVAGCKDDASKTPKEKVSEFPRNETLYIGGFDWAPPTTFNPLDPDPNFPTDGNIRLMYESLLTFNQLTENLDPMLADGFTQTDSSITVHLDSRAKWNNGEPVTPDDVIYSFRIDSLLPTAHHNNWKHFKSITDDGDNHITFLLSDNKNPLMALNAIAETSILPKSVFEPLIKSAKSGKTYSMEKILKFTNDSHPIASGPYTLKTYTPDQIVLERVENYWRQNHYGKRKPAPKYIIHPIYDKNDNFNSAMIRGNLDVSSIFLPRIWEKSKDSIRAWSREEPYQLPSTLTALIIATTKEPFNNVAFRRALAHSIDFEKIKAKAFSNYTPAIQPGFILPFGTEKKYFNKEDIETYGYSYNTDKAREILAEAGYSWNEEGKLLDKKKKPVRTISIECPQGWTDWIDAINVLTESFAEIGITAEAKIIDYGIWDTNIRRGTFDLSLKTPPTEHSVANPWHRFYQMLSTANYKPVGEETFANPGRFQNAEINNLVMQIPTITAEDSLVETYRELNKLFMQTVPLIPLMYRPSTYYQFSTKHWTNFPTEENPYAPPNNLIVAAGVSALWEIVPVEQPDNQ